MKTIEGLAVTFTANGKRQIQVGNFSKILRKEGDKNWKLLIFVINS